LRLNNEHPNCLKAIRSVNGTEFKNTSFDEFCLEHGVVLLFHDSILLRNVAILISLSLALLMLFCLDTPLMTDLIEFIILRLTPLLSYVM
jgi:hypothetical protein